MLLQYILAAAAREFYGVEFCLHDCLSRLSGVSWKPQAKLAGDNYAKSCET